MLNDPITVAMWTVIPSMKADIVDEDESRNGERREASFESAFSLVLKMSSTLFFAVSANLNCLGRLRDRPTRKAGRRRIHTDSNSHVRNASFILNTRSDHCATMAVNAQKNR